jgi:stage II sporulation protein M
LIAVIAVAFFSVLILAAVVTFLVLVSNPGFINIFQSALGSAGSYMAIPPPYTNGLYQFIFLNNIAHFWNPIRLWVWIPVVGAFELGYELILNAVLIGGVASLVSLTKSPLYAIEGLAPHGVIEIPAFILEFTGLARWHVSSIRALQAKFGGRLVDWPLLKEGVKDALVLSLLSVMLFAVAAYIETFITPHLLGR